MGIHSLLTEILFFSSSTSQPFPTRPLSESQNRLLAGDNQWVEVSSEDEAVKSGMHN